MAERSSRAWVHQRPSQSRRRIRGDNSSHCSRCVGHSQPQEGVGVEQDLAEAARLYTLAAEAGRDTAQYNLGMMYRVGAHVGDSPHTHVHLVGTHRRMARGWSNKATRARSNGSGWQPTRETRTLKAAWQHFTRSATSSLLSLCWHRFSHLVQPPPNAGARQNGRGVEQDYEETVRLFKLAAEEGHALAEYNLGKMYWVRCRTLL